MANPTLPADHLKADQDNLYLECEGVIVNNKVVISTQVATITDAVVAHSLTDTDASLGATTQAEIEGVLDALGVKINLLIAALDAHGLTADA